MQRLAMVVDLLRCYSNFVEPHLRLGFGEVTRAPAMQVNVFSKALSWRALLTWLSEPQTPASV